MKRYFIEPKNNELFSAILLGAGVGEENVYRNVPTSEGIRPALIECPLSVIHFLERSDFLGSFTKFVQINEGEITILDRMHSLKLSA